MTTKLLLAAIAMGLWANAAATLVRPARAAQFDALETIATELHELVWGGPGCRNNKICD